MHFRTFAFIALAFAMTSVARGAVWSSPDGNVSVTIPSDGSFVVVPNPPAPAIVLWQLSDGTRVFIAKADNPQNIPLEKAGLEEGTLNQVPGTLISSVETSLKGVPVFTIAVRGNIQGHSIYAMQKIAAFDSVVYKLMVGGPVDCTSDPRIVPVFDSFTILSANPRVPAAPKSSNPFSHERSVGIAQIGWTVLFIALIVVVIRKVISSGPKPMATPGWGLAIDQVGAALLIARVNPDSPASRSGLLPGDRILRINDIEVANAQSLSNLLGQQVNGPAVTIAIERNGMPMDLVLKS